MRVQDILEAIASVERYTTGMTVENFKADETIAKAMLYDFIVIGEAATNIPLDIQVRCPQIPWRLMSDMRNVITHEYFQVNLERVWRTAPEDLPPLVLPLQNLLHEE